MLTLEEISVVVEACHTPTDRGTLSYRAGLRVPGVGLRVVLAAIDKLLKLDVLRIDNRDRKIEVTPRGLQALKESTCVLEDLVGASGRARNRKMMRFYEE